MPHLVIDEYTVTRDLLFVNILLSLFVIMTKIGKSVVLLFHLQILVPPTQSWYGTPPNKACSRQVGLPLTCTAPNAVRCKCRGVRDLQAFRVRVASGYTAPKQNPHPPHLPVKQTVRRFPAKQKVMRSF